MLNRKLFNLYIKTLSNAKFSYTSVLSYTNNTLHRSNILKGVDKNNSEDSNEIINISNDSKSLSIPRVDTADFPKFYFENESFQIVANERSTIDLSPSMHANLPKPPSEAVEIHERPYDSIVSLGEKYQKNDKFISEELLDALKKDNISHSQHLLSEERKLWLYFSNEKRFNIKISANAADLISQCRLSVDTALEYQNDVMKQVTEYWLNSIGLMRTESNLFLFLPFSPDDDSKIHIDLLIEMYNLLNINNKHEDIIGYKNGQLSYSDLMNKIDVAVREIVDQWYRTNQRDLTA